MKDTVMIVDDNEELRRVLRLYLENAGYEIIEAENGRVALDQLKDRDISIMVLDIMMPVMDGFQLLGTLGDERDFPVIFLSAKGEVSDRIMGLNLGGDDYMCKPFDPSEVVARVLAVLRRSEKRIDKNVEIGSLKWDRENRRVYLDEEILELRAKEYNLLTMFMRRPGKVFTKQEIYEILWDEPYFDDHNTIMVHISNLREKIEVNPSSPRKIITIRGLGYMMDKGD